MTIGTYTEGRPAADLRDGGRDRDRAMAAVTRTTVERPLDPSSRSEPGSYAP